MALTFTETRATLDEISERVNAARVRMDQGRALYTKAQAELVALPSEYMQFVNDLNEAASLVTWSLAPSQKAEKDQMVADFQALKNLADAILAAIDGV